MIKNNVMTIYYNQVVQKEYNAKYPYSKEVSTVEDLKEVVQYDHTGVHFENGYRKNENFIETNCQIFDVDNTESDYKEEWVQPNDVREAFPDVPFFVVYSRNHMKPKSGKLPRPKFHIYFFDKKWSDSQFLSEYKNKVCNYFQSFDKNAKDVGRFFFGVENPKVEYFEGNTLLSDFMNNIEVVRDVPNLKEKDIIPEGKRNSILFKTAMRVLNKYTNNEQMAKKEFLDKSLKCKPPLSETEICDIWNSALKRYKKDKEFRVPELPIVDYNSYKKLEESSDKNMNITYMEYFLKSHGISVRHNEMCHTMEVSGIPKVYKGDDEVHLLTILLSDSARRLKYRYSSEKDVYSSLEAISVKNRYHPVIEILTINQWDGIDRICEIYRILGITDEFYQILIKKWALQTVAILYNTLEDPISAQGVLVLQGGQGIGKTEFFRHLAIKDSFFKGGVTLDMTNKDSIMSATKTWICELGEIDATTKKEQATLKAFLTKGVDSYREPYAREEKIRIRKTSFCGTVNPKEYLVDVTGNRRFWTVPVEKIDIDAIFRYPQEWYIQFWLQIFEEYRKNPKSYLLTKEEQQKVNMNNSEFENSLYGEDEFMTCFDTATEMTFWEWRTASEIVNILNERYKGLNLSSSVLGRNILPRIEIRLDIKFKRRTKNNNRQILCPPLSQIESDRENMSEPINTELPNYSDFILQEKSNDDEVIEF